MRKLRSKWRARAVFACVCFGLSGFMVYSASIGEHGLEAQKNLELRIAVLNAQLRDLKTERTSFERKASLLRTESLDPDLLEERARDVLGMVHPNDVVINKK